MAKQFLYRGKTIQELQELTIREFSEILPSSARRKIRRGFTDAEKKFLNKIRQKKKSIKTHCRDMIILPEMVGIEIKIHSGKAFEPILIQDEMVGHRLGEFVLTRRRVGHSSPGVGSTRSSHVSAK